jgi:hypothetical protein
MSLLVTSVTGEFEFGSLAHVDACTAVSGVHIEDSENHLFGLCR